MINAPKILCEYGILTTTRLSANEEDVCPLPIPLGPGRSLDTEKDNPSLCTRVIMSGNDIPTGTTLPFLVAI